MNSKSLASKAQIVRCLCEGNSIRSTSRLCGCAINTVIKLLLEMGTACSAYQDRELRNLNSMVVQVDEIWSFVGCKQKNADQDKQAQGMGDVWTWTALDADSKLMITWLIGGRGEGYAQSFMFDLAERLNKRIQISSDGHNAYKNAVKLAFGANVDYGQIIKEYGSDIYAEKRYSPAVCTSVTTKSVVGDPIESQISTSYVERSNLTIRMSNRRFTRLTNAFSKKIENHIAAFSLYAMHYNFCKKHGTVKTSPAVAAGVTDHIWTVEEMIETVLKSN